jgi:transposase
VLERQHGGWRFEFASLAISQPLIMAARKKRHEYTTDQRTQILLLKGRGCTEEEIAKKLGVSRSGVGKCWRRANERGSIVAKHRSGRPKKAIDSALHHAKLDLKRGRIKSAAEILDLVQQEPASASRSARSSVACTTRAIELLS